MRCFGSTSWSVIGVGVTAVGVTALGVTAVGVTDVGITAVVLGVIAPFVSVTSLSDTMGVVTSSGVALWEVPTVVDIAPLLGRVRAVCVRG